MAGLACNLPRNAGCGQVEFSFLTRLVITNPDSFSGVRSLLWQSGQIPDFVQPWMNPRIVRGIRRADDARKKQQQTKSPSTFTPCHRLNDGSQRHQPNRDQPKSPPQSARHSAVIPIVRFAAQIKFDDNQRSHDSHEAQPPQRMRSSRLTGVVSTVGRVLSMSVILLVQTRELTQRPPPSHQATHLWNPSIL